jgi:Protein of unknown function (DUF4054)
VTTPAITFVFSDWVAQFGEFAAVNPVAAQAWFNRATNFCSNDTCNPAYVQDPTGGILTGLLYLLTAHIAWLNAPRDAFGNPAATGAPASPIVGRINTASEGSISVGADMGDANEGSPSQAWFMTTRYGAEFWYASVQYRHGFYVAQPTILPENSLFFPYGPHWRSGY